MRRIILSLLLLLPWVVQAHTIDLAVETGQSRDSVIMRSDLYFDYNINQWISGSQHTKMARFLASVKRYPESKISLVGWTDDTGGKNANKEFSYGRAKCIMLHLVRNGVDPERITAKGMGIDYQAASDAKARRVEATQVIELADEQPSAVEFSQEVSAEEPQLEPVVEEVVSQPGPQYSVNAEPEFITIRKPALAIKTNLLYDAAMTPNLEVEVPIGKRWSINAEYQFAWWNKRDNSFCWRINSGGIEGRFWFGDREKHNPLNGWFIGVFVNGGTYDFQLSKKSGYQGDFIIPGVSGGYAMPISSCLGLEFSLGVGYMMSNYYDYDIANRELAGDREMKQFRNIFPAKAKVSLVWMINRNVKKLVK